ncbi:MAG: hypothetical protein RIS94_3298 [Pseudomonadota bacterium]|jgi:hypothetical protein
MAQRGRKPDTSAAKVARGTMKPTPDVLAQFDRDPADVPIRWSSLSPEAADVWDREIEHFIAAGANRKDSAFLNHTVMMIADYELRSKMYQEGAEGIDAPPITMAVELRVRLEGLGMAGAKSRVARMGAGGPAQAKGNAFAANGNRPRA